MKTIPFYSLFKNLARDLPIFLCCFGVSILGYILINYAIYFLNDTAWDSTLCQRPIYKYGMYNTTILYCISLAIWLFQIPYEILKYLHISARFFLEPILFAPILEESAFRGVLLLFKMTNREWFLAALLLNLIFTLGHYGKPIIWILNTFFLGSISCYAAYKTKRLWASIMLHASFNGLLLSQKLAE